MNIEGISPEGHEPYEYHEQPSGQGSGDMPFAPAEGYVEETLITPGGPPPDAPDWASLSLETSEATSDNPEEEQGDTPAPAEPTWALYDGYGYPIAPTLPDGSTAGEIITNPTVGTPVLQEVDPTLMPGIVAREGRQWLKSREHLGTLPTGEDNTTANPIIVRVFPKPAVETPPMTVAEAEQRVAITLEHFRFLAGTEEKPGIVIPDTYYQVQTRPDGSVYTSNITVQLNGETPDAWAAAEQTTWQLIHDPIAQITDKLGDYYEWIFATGQTLFLSDISRIDQYAFTADNRPEIHDTDPHIDDLNTREGWDEMEKSIADLTTLNNCLPESPQKEKTRAVCNRLRRHIYQAEDERIPYLPSKWDHPIKPPHTP